LDTIFFGSTVFSSGVQLSEKTVFLRYLTEAIFKRRTVFFSSIVFGSKVQVSEKTVSLRDSPEAGLTKSGFFLFNRFQFRKSLVSKPLLGHHFFCLSVCELESWQWFSKKHRLSEVSYRGNL
jgi:hypothetical protein